MEGQSQSLHVWEKLKKGRNSNGIPLGSIKTITRLFYLYTLTYKYKESVFILTKPPPKKTKQKERNVLTSSIKNGTLLGHFKN